MPYNLLCDLESLRDGSGANHTSSSWMSKKAYDRETHTWLSHTLERSGLPKDFNWLINISLQRITAPGFLSEPSQWRRGDPWVPIVFNIALQPYIDALNKVGIKAHARRRHSSHYHHSTTVDKTPANDQRIQTNLRQKSKYLSCRGTIPVHLSTNKGKQRELLGVLSREGESKPSTMMKRIFGHHLAAQDASPLQPYKK